MRYGNLTLEEAEQIIIDLCLGREPSVTGADADAFREDVKKDIDKMTAEGIAVELPPI